MKGYWDKDFYQITYYGNEPYIQIDGYFYISDTGYDEDGNLNEKYCYRAVDYSGVEFPLQEFIDRFVNGNEDYSDTEEYINRKEYIEDCTEEMAIDYMAHFYNGDPATPLLFSELNMDTPCGYYVDARPDNE